MAQLSAKIRAASISILTATSLAILKLVAGVMTGSMAVLSSAIDSLLDILMSGVNFLAIRQAEQPADENHPFGHGKYETLATMIQSLVIAGSGIWIIAESISRLRAGVTLTRIDSGIVVLLIGTIASVLISRYLRRVAKATDSSALQADSLHFAMDVYTNLGLMLGLILIRFVAIPWLDPVLSILIACYILFEALRLVRQGLRDVLDEELPAVVRDEVDRLIQAHEHDITGYHNLRTRRAGSQKIMDFHLTVCKHLSVEEAHSIADHLEKRIEADIQGADVTIHIEPCRREHCPGREDCPSDSTRLDEDDQAAS
ncbi:cation diffusion facilitator family transporter [Desulfuromonas carbonis]|uniref:cation diffusion facilitator family transporter n=1 Tax=Desulfuromonas sp. DDH964 TaxID=1823759 RepID=UPI00078C2A54|nr:cation diffusion facilitator family transporter [Desulfuromonas sp. DDH964]AMV72050.1 iron/zinc/nickel/cobalt/cadmium efflux protein [Desulfuromonas sp. DDH964]